MVTALRPGSCAGESTFDDVDHAVALAPPSSLGVAMFLLRCLVLPQDAQEPVLSDLDVLRVHHVVAEAAVG
jgi:hypothetical protein